MSGFRLGTRRSCRKEDTKVALGDGGYFGDIMLFFYSFVLFGRGRVSLLVCLLFPILCVCVVFVCG